MIVGLKGKNQGMKEDDELLSAMNDSFKSVYQGFVDCFLKTKKRELARERERRRTLLKGTLVEKAVHERQEKKNDENEEHSFESPAHWQLLNDAKQKIQRLGEITQELKKINLPNVSPNIMNMTGLSSRAKSASRLSSRTNTQYGFGKKISNNIKQMKSSMMHKILALSPVQSPLSQSHAAKRNVRKSVQDFPLSCKIEDVRAGTDIATQSPDLNYHAKLIREKFKTKMNSQLLTPLEKKQKISLSRGVQLRIIKFRKGLRRSNSKPIIRIRKRNNGDKISLQANLTKASEVYQAVRTTFKSPIHNTIRGGNINSARTSPRCTPHSSLCFHRLNSNIPEFQAKAW